MSGKSTILKSIIGLTKISSGEIKVNNISTTEKKFNYVLNLWEWFLKKDALFDGMKVWENIMFKSLNDEKNNDLIKMLKKLLKSVGLPNSDAFLYPSELSGGMRKGLL